MASYATTLLCALLVLLALSQACSTDPTPTSTPSPTHTPVPVSTSTPTSQPTPPPTPTLTAAPSHTPTAAFTSPPPTAGPTPSPVVSTPPPGARGGSLTSLALADFPHLDVQQESQETLTALGPGIAYSRLLRLRSGPQDRLPQPNLLLECDLCQGWELVGDSPLQYRFTLREGVRWHDAHPVGGRKLTAQDVAFSYERQKTTGFPNASILRNLELAVAEDDRTLLITVNPRIPRRRFSGGSSRRPQQDCRSRGSPTPRASERRPGHRDRPLDLGRGQLGQGRGLCLQQEPQLLRRRAALPGPVDLHRRKGRSRRSTGGPLSPDRPNCCEFPPKAGTG